MSILNSVAQNYKNFLVTKYLPLDELRSTLIELVHEPSGARVMHIVNEDPENLFCLSFQTFPSSSNGVAHILEHTVLCGSRKFPVKDPFFAMTRRSLNTYMNALTGQDFTCYPASSQVEKDFYNLLEVYLDSVFHPQLKALSFLQEGHRLEFKGEHLQIQGVVYNEMKGAMSTPESRLWEALAKRLIPDLPYCHNSGGNPKEIPNLTYEELLDFHRVFYHPSRCLFFFYGNLPLAKHLDFLEEELKKAKKEALLPPLPKQPRFEEPVFAEEFFPVTEGGELKSQIAFAWLTAPICNTEEVLALELIETILTDTDASLLTMALLKSGLCTQVESSLDLEMSEIPWVITCKGCEAKDAEKLQKILFDALKKTVFQDEQIEAALHQLEFERTEIGGEGVPFGLSLFMRSALLKQHGSQAEKALLVHSLFADLKDRLKDPNYLPAVLCKYITENPHFVRLTLHPDANLPQKEEMEEQKKLEEIEKRLTPEEKASIREGAAKLKAYQEEIEHQSLDCLPKVTLNDVPKHLRDFSLIQNGNVFHHSCFTNRILYADLIFDLPDLKEEELPLLSFFTQALPELGCGGRDYEENLIYQQRYIGEFEASLSLHVNQEEPNFCRPTLALRGKALYENEEKLFQLFHDFVTSVDLDDKERIREWLSQHATEQKEKLNGAAMSYAIQTALKGLCLPSFIYEKWNGMSYYQSVLHWEKHFNDGFIDRLKEMAHKILGLKNHKIVLSCDEAHYQQLEKKISSHLRWTSKSYEPWKGTYPLPPPEAGVRFIAAPVAFSALGMSSFSYRNAQAPMLLIAAELMKNLILHKEIREKGGAYSSGASYNPSTGNFYFFSYRDPQLQSSLDTFQRAIEDFGHFNQRELEEAKLGVLQTLDAPVAPGNRAMLAYSWLLSGRTHELREQFRNRVIRATQSEVIDSVNKGLLAKETVFVSFLGKELFAKEQKKLKKPIPVLD